MCKEATDACFDSVPVDLPIGAKQNKIMRANTSLLSGILSAVLLIACWSPAHAQRGRRLLGGAAERNLDMYECGSVFEPTLKDRLNPMAAVQGAMGNAFTVDGINDLGRIAISVFYQAHQHPQQVVRFATETPGWETCGDAIYLGMTNKSGLGIANTDGDVTVDGAKLENAGIGTYYTGFSPDNRGNKTVQITSSDGDEITVDIGPAAPLTILSIDGKPVGEIASIDGTKDIVIELENGDQDPNSFLHVSLVSKVVGTPIMYDVQVVKATNRIVIPKEAFFNYEGSPSPFLKENTLVVNRVVETVLDGTDAGAIRTLSCYMDWAPVTMEGDVAKGSLITAGFDTTKNTQINLSIEEEGEYTFSLKKGSPWNSPPVSRMKKVAVASFVVRGNLESEETTITSTDYSTWKTTITKWFPEVSVDNWKSLTERMYSDFEERLRNELGVMVVPLEEVVNTNSYQYTKPIRDEVTQTYVEVGAGGTERILTTSTTDLFTDLEISFASDFVGDRLAKELGVDAVIAVTIDLNMNFESEGLDPSVNLAFFAPNLGYKSKSTYFSATGETNAVPLSEASDYTGGAANQLYEMIKAGQMMEEMFTSIEMLETAEQEEDAYQILWQNR